MVAECFYVLYAEILDAALAYYYKLLSRCVYNA